MTMLDVVWRRVAESLTAAVPAKVAILLTHTGLLAMYSVYRAMLSAMESTALGLDTM
jgi:hypothetical protein